MLRILSLAILLVGFTSASAQKEVRDVLLGPETRQDLSLTVYNGGFAQVRDVRRVDVRRGLNRLQFEDVSARIAPQTALFKGGNFRLIEQNFDFDLLTPQKLLEKSVGQTVRLYRTHPTTGEDMMEEALVLSANNGAVLQIGDRIEVLQSPQYSQLVFDELPPNLRAKPTLSALAAFSSDYDRNVELSYLTAGVSWSADYVGNLNADQTSMDLQAWVTLSNNSGGDFNDTTLKVVAGTVDASSIFRSPLSRGFASRGVGAMLNEMPQFAPATLGDVYVFEIPSRVSVRNNQNKQLALFATSNVPVSKVYSFEDYGDTSDGFDSADLYLAFQNTEASNLGFPLPEGVLRLYLEDENEQSQYIGEGDIHNTPKGERIETEYGKAFDVTARVRQLRTSVRPGENFQVRSGEFEVTFRNTREEAVEVEFYRVFCDDWEVTASNIESEVDDQRTALFRVPVPAKGEFLLTASFSERC